MSFNPDELQTRKESMFGWSFGDQTLSCKECGALVSDRDAHFGWHLKIDNIDQRVVTITQARDGLSEWEGH